jgi:hypothetical protein
VESPVWELNPAQDEGSRAMLGALRVGARGIRDAAGIRLWLGVAVKIGMDPL